MGYNQNTITGEYWYKMTAIREVNQIIGRCIRHQNDYAAIFLIDERYEAPTNHTKLSKWIRDKLRKYDQFDSLNNDLNTFFIQN
jgi:Rad3-related DNA helicase